MRTPVAVGLLCASVALSACGRTNGRTGQGPYADMVADDIPKIEQAVGVKYKTPPKLEERSREQIREFVTRQFNEETPAAQLEGEEAAYKAFGLIRDSLHLRKFLIDLLTEQIIGYYDPATKVLYVTQGAPADVASVTISHELVHALQDQYVNLDSIQKATKNSDRQSAAQAVIEGEAMYEQMVMAAGGGNIGSFIPGGWDALRDQIRELQSSQPIFSSAPMAIQEELLFPYLSGAEFVRRYKEHFPGKLPFSNMPVSTTQILHEDAYFGAHPEVPVVVHLPPADGKVIYENVLGEFETRLVIYQHTKDQTLATRAAAGLAGDAYRVQAVAGGNALVWVTVWNTAMDAAEFVDAIGQAVTKRYAASAPSAGAGGRRSYASAKRGVDVILREIDGHNVVVYVDAPAGASRALIDPAKVKLEK
jgi:hypothetical protein